MRRVVDIVVSTVAAILLSPVIITITITIWCVCGSPVIFRQDRWGLNGDVFVIWKFRTMRPPIHPGEPDSRRLLPLGDLLRRTSLDELPQLWNILRGDMSLVGPRPLPVHLGQEVVYTPRQWGRLSVRPGLTGWAQVSGRNSLTWSEKIDQDLWYIAHRSLLLDLRIIALTVVQVIRPRGIYGYGAENPGFVPDTQAPALGSALDRSHLAPRSPVPGPARHEGAAVPRLEAMRTTPSKVHAETSLSGGRSLASDQVRRSAL
jgi:lipopolysaccharide/colanic/teichoic acid biosynthesis glycosyltransferase